VSRKATILAVDDAPANLLALEAVLESHFNLTRARSGPEAISLLKAGADIDVILMDVQMPGMDGYEAAREIKKIPGCGDIPIIFITAVYKEDAFVKRGYAVGGVDYFTKPFDPELLRLKMAIYASFRQKAAVLKERARQIRETEELVRVGRKLSAILETLPVGVLIADIEGRICQTNEEVSRICKSVAQIQNDAYGAVLGWWDSSGRMLKDDQGPLAEALRHGKTSHNQLLRICCLDGSSKAILASASPLLGLDGQIMGAVVLIQDVTEPRRIGAELEDRVTRLVSLGVELEQSVNP
jgi:CheY-like chemotaxis protein